MIDEMVDGDGLHKRVREAVPSQFVGELADRLKARLSEVREKRDGDLELLERAEAGEGPWWEWRETFDGLGELEQYAMVMKNADEGDKLEVETVDHETYVGTVIPSEVENKCVRLDLEGTGIDADEVKLITSKDDVWSRPTLRTIEVVEIDGATGNKLKDTYVSGVFRP